MQYIVEKDDVGKRLDIYVSLKDKSITRSYIKNLIDNKNVAVNGKYEKAGYKLRENDVVEIILPEVISTDIKPEKIDLDIMYEDEDILIINKPKGMVVHPANGNYTGTMVNALMESHGNSLSSINGVIRPGIVHRIDKDTSGILVVAKNDNAHKNLADQFKVHSIKREYVALVKGIIKEDEFTVDLPIGRSSKDRKKMAVVATGRRAVTHIKVLERLYNSNLTLIQATLETGRTHQIRVHMAYMHHPLLGDLVYGNKDSKLKVEGQVLHAKLLGIIHPSTGEYMEFISPLPNEFEKLLKSLENKENNC